MQPCDQKPHQPCDQALPGHTLHGGSASKNRHNTLPRRQLRLKEAEPPGSAFPGRAWQRGNEGRGTDRQSVLRSSRDTWLEGAAGRLPGFHLLRGAISLTVPWDLFRIDLGFEVLFGRPDPASWRLLRRRGEGLAGHCETAACTFPHLTWIAAVAAVDRRGTLPGIRLLGTGGGAPCCKGANQPWRAKTKGCKSR